MWDVLTPLERLHNTAPHRTQVLIKVHASSLNHEYKLFKLMPSLANGGVGWDVAGTVVAVGAAVTTHRVGDAVFGHCDMGKKDGGGLCEYAVTQAAWVVAKPAGVSFAEAACLNVVGVTALRSLEATAVKPGEKLLVVGGSGGVGSLAIQIAKLLGIGRVVAVCGDKNVDFCKSLGADAVCSYTAGEAQLVASLREHAPFDGAFDTVTSPDDPPYEHLLRPVLKRGGMLVAINGGMSDFVRAMMSGSCLNLQRRNFRLVIDTPNAQTAPELARIGAWVAEKKVRVTIDSTVPFTAEGIAEGYDKMVGRRVRGKVAVIMVA